MAHKSGWDTERIALSVRVGAMVTVLGFLLLAAEQRLTRDVPPQEIVASETVPAPNGAAPAPVAAQSGDYFPSHFPAPSGQAEDQAPTF